MPLTAPTKTDGSIGRVKSDIGSAPNLDNYVPAAEYERLKDALIALYTQQTPAWEWNETDATQFQVAQAGIGTPTLSVVSKDWGPALRIAFPTKTTGSLGCFVTVNDADLVIEKDASNRYFYTVSARLVGFSGASGEWGHVGLATLCNRQTGASFYGLGVVGSVSGTNRKSVRVQAGAFSLGGGNYSGIGADLSPATAGVQLQNWFELDVHALHNGGAPFFRSRFQIEQNDGSERISTSYDDQYAINQHGAFGAGWNTETLDSVGIAFVGGLGTTAGQYFEFDQIRVCRHPTKRW